MANPSTPGPQTTFPVKPISVTIRCPPQAVYEFAVRPENLHKWATGLGTSGSRDGDDWVAQMPLGTVRIRFVPRNDLGVLDHSVTLPNGDVVYSPMRVIANGTGSEVTFTLFRLPDMTDEQFKTDAATVQHDLQTLKALLER